MFSFGSNRVFINGVDVSGGATGEDRKNVINIYLGDAKNPGELVRTVELKGKVELTVNGSCESVEIGSGSVAVIGNSGPIVSTSGDVSVTGRVGGSVTSTSGDITCNDVDGDVSTVSGDVQSGEVSGSVQSTTGDISVR